jgi:hypothetical protein
MTEQLCQCAIRPIIAARGCYDKCPKCGKPYDPIGLTPPVDEREKAKAEAWESNHENAHIYYENGFKHGFDAGWNARDAEVERLKGALESYKSRVLPRP